LLVSSLAGAEDRGFGIAVVWLVGREEPDALGALLGVAALIAAANEGNTDGSGCTG
jgi:hypothetical protein